MKISESVFYESSTIKVSEYNFKKNQLIVTFHSGAIYMYDNVSVDVYEKFSTADSQGKALNQHIKNTEIKTTKIN